MTPTNTTAAKAADTTTFSYQDFRDVFLTVLQGMLQHNGLFAADAGHYRSLVNNATGLALVAERRLRQVQTNGASVAAKLSEGEIFPEEPAS